LVSGGAGDERRRDGKRREGGKEGRRSGLRKEKEQGRRRRWEGFQFDRKTEE
jgi:hypothetical protein